MKTNSKVNLSNSEKNSLAVDQAPTFLMEPQKTNTKVGLKKKKKDASYDEQLLATTLSEDPIDPMEWSRVLGDVHVAQVDAAAIAGASSGAGAGAAGAAAAAGAGTVGVAAATSLTALTTTVTTVTAVGAATTAPTLGVVAGAAAAAGGGGGGGSSSPSLPINTGPQPLNIPTFTLDDPPTIPRPTPNPSPNPATYGPDSGSPINGGGNDLFDASTSTIPPFELQALTSQLENLPGRPGNSLYKSLVIDLNSTLTSGDYRVYYYTQKELTQSNEFTTIGYYKGFKDVTGTILSDMISGNNQANILDGSSGNDLIYGGGGADTLYGGRGTDWILFKALTRDVPTSDDQVYATSLKVNMSSSTVDTLAAGNFVYGATPVAGTLSGFENAVGSDGADLIIGSDFSNTLVGASGNDDIRAGAGDDILYGGAGTNKLAGGSGADIFYVGYDLDPVKLSQRLAESQWLTSVTGTDIILDWDASSGASSRDTLVVNNNGIAILAGLANQATPISMSGDNTIDLRDKVTNTGIIRLASGVGDNQIWLSSGRDMVYVGYEFDSTGSLVGKTNAYDRIWDWDASATNPDTVRDYLQINAANRAVLASILSPTGQRSYTWSGNDVLDLRDTNLIDNNGTLIVDVGSIDDAQDYDLVYGTDGADYLSAGNSGDYSIRLNSKPGDILWGGDGADRFYVGYQYNTSTEGDGASYVENFVEQTYNATAVVMDWKSGTDSLYLAQESTAIIGGLDTTSFANTDWSIQNTVDLRTNVFNLAKTDATDGKIVVRAGAGNDVVYGSTGNDWVYVGSAESSGHDYVDLGEVNNSSGSSGDGADRVYIDNWNTRTVVDGFDANDNLYIDRRMIADFLSTSGIQTFKHLNSTESAFVTDVRDFTAFSPNLIRDSSIFPANVPIETRVSNTTAPQIYDDGKERSLLGLKLSTSDYVYGGAYYSTLNSSSSLYDGLAETNARWFSNGAYTNATHIQAEYAAESALVGAATAAFAIGYALIPIPFVGPILAAPFITMGAFYVDDKINNTFAHLNPEFKDVDLTSSYAATLKTSTFNVTSTSDAVFNQRFTQLFNAPSDGFKPSVEFTGSVTGNLSINNGVGGIVTVTDSANNDTLVYLVYSPDRMVQDNETRLIAHIRGSTISASQIQIYDGQADIYQISDSAAISPPPDVSLIDIAFPLTDGPDVIAASSSKPEQIYNLDANDYVTVDFSFDRELRIGDVLTVRKVIKVSDTVSSTVEYVFTKAASGFTTTVTDGVITSGVSANRYLFEDRSAIEVLGQERLVTYSVDVSRGDFSKTSNTQSLVIGLKGVSVNAYSSFNSVDEANLVFDYPYQARVDVEPVGSDTVIGTKSGTTDTSVANRTLTLTAPVNAGFYDLEVNPASGPAYIMQEKLYLGSDTNNTQTATSGAAHIMFGFAGNDTLTGGAGSDLIYGGVGNDILSGSGGGDILSGGAGKDTITGGGGDDTFVFDHLGFSQRSFYDSNLGDVTLTPPGTLPAEDFDIIQGFASYASALASGERDVLQLKGSVFTGIVVDDPSDNIKISSTSNIAGNNVSGTGVTLSIDPVDGKLAEVDFSDLTAGQSVNVAGLILTANSGATLLAKDIAAAYANLGAGATSGNAIVGGSWGGTLASGFMTRQDTDINISASEFATINSNASSVVNAITNSDPTLQAELRVQKSIEDALVINNSANLFYDTYTGKLYYDANSNVNPTSSAEYMSYVQIATLQGPNSIIPTLSHMDFAVI